ncbi:MAG: DinB family protein, partial [Pseudomonadota bacterium]
NHQTHHRGQAHAMVTAAGAMPEDTDLVAMPPVT